MKIHCHTNLDLLPAEKWPDDLPVCPGTGDLIQSAQRWPRINGDGSETPSIYSVLCLEVVRVTWASSPAVNVTRSDGSFVRRKPDEWYPDIEIHLPKGRFGSIRDFYEWYAKITGKRVSYFI